jgi:MFS family permease
LGLETLTVINPSSSRSFGIMTLYQWTVLLAAWLGWGFDIFDSLLFNYVAPNCVPTLLGLPIESPEAKAATLLWTGIITSTLLVGWAIGGVIFGKVADSIGRSKTLLITMLCYALGTALCALAPNIWILILCRAIASLGIGGEWAAGATMVAEVVPEKWRLEAGALLYTSSPLGLFLATFLNFQISGVLYHAHPEYSWRYVFLCGLIPAVVAIAIRLLIKEPERWQSHFTDRTPPKISELFTPKYFHLTRSGLIVSFIALLTWWSLNAFIPIIAADLAKATAVVRGLNKVETSLLTEQWKALANNNFNLGGLVGTLLTIPIAKILGRKKLFQLYFGCSVALLCLTFGLNLPPQTRFAMYLPMGLTVFGVFGSFSYYLTELFPTRLRATGAGFCYNIGRIVAAGGPFLVGAIASNGSQETTFQVLFATGLIPLIGLCLMPWVIETKGKSLPT